MSFNTNNSFDQNRSVYRFDFDLSLLSSPPTSSREFTYSSITDLPVLGIGDATSFSVTISIKPLRESDSREVLNRQFGKLNQFNNTLSFTLDPPLEIGPGRVDVTLSLDEYQWPENIETTSGSSHLFFMTCLNEPNCGTFRDSWNNLTVEFNHLTCLDPNTDLFGAYQTTCLNTLEGMYMYVKLFT